jgi:hypothetical protein
MNADQLAAIAALNKEKEQWKCSLLVDSFDATGNPVKKNLIDYLVPNEHVQQILQTKMKFPKKTWYRFLKKYDGIEGYDRLIAMIKDAANEGGFSLTVSRRCVGRVNFQTNTL